MVLEDICAACFGDLDSFHCRREGLGGHFLGTGGTDTDVAAGDCGSRGMVAVVKRRIGVGIGSNWTDGGC